ncbi:protease complex subunit PrcB family protein [Brevibacillus marinus]|uniref:protease complex subunit PrcB family protein n=1 Tax=Brevibacillus marinus TaxID=2496837 RepID=UPI000F820086|nr:protease complex subunit PrcB family protein [Brevibacillus marinus]
MKGIVTLWLSLSILVTGGAAAALPQPASDGPLPAVSFNLAAPPYPNQVAEAWQALRKAGGWEIIRLDGKSYLVIAAGQRPTGGYSLHIERIEETADGKTVIYVAEHKPAAAAVTTQALSYPSLVAVLPDQDRPIEVVYTKA